MAAPGNNPYDQYRQTQINTANQGKLIVMLYEGAIKFLNIAIENMQPKSYDIVNTNIIKAQDIITELMLSLNMKEGGDVSNNLMSLYVYFKKRLIEANVNKDSEIIKEVLKLMTELRDAWEQISAKESKNDEYRQSKGSFSVEG